MKVTEWKTYRTRFLVKAKQLNSTLTFTDHLGRQHCGRKGDYLVESFDGVISIAPRRIFEDIYVPMASVQETASLQEIGGAPEPALSLSKGLTGFVRPGKLESSTGEARVDSVEGPPLSLPTVRVEPLPIERIKHAVLQYASRDAARPRTDLGRTRRRSPLLVSSPAARVPLM